MINNKQNLNIAIIAKTNNFSNPAHVIINRTNSFFGDKIDNFFNQKKNKLIPNINPNPNNQALKNKLKAKK